MGSHQEDLTALLAEERAARGLAERNLDRMARLHSVTAALSTAVTLVDVAQVIVRQGLDVLLAKTAVLGRRSADGERLEMVATAGVPEAVAERWVSIPLDAKVPVVTTLVTGEPVWIASPAEYDAHFPERGGAQLAAAGIQALATVPLGPLSSMGVLGFTFAEPHQFSPDERAILMTLARLGGQALDRARLYHEIEAAAHASRVSAERLRTLAEASRVFAAASLDYDAILKLVTKRIADLLGDGCALRLLRDDVEQGGGFEFLPVVCAHDRDPRMAALLRDLGAQSPPLLADDAIAKVLQSGRTVLVPSLVGVSGASLDDAQRELLEGFPVRSLMVAPLRTQGRTLGILACVRHGEDHPYNTEDQLLLEDLADRAALAIENARLYRDAREAVRTREEFLSIAGHELRTPLTTLRIQIQSLIRLGKEERDERAVDRLTRASSQVDRLTRLVNELVDVTRLASGQIAMTSQPMDLAALTHEVVARFSEELSRSGSTITVTATDQAGGTWDAVRLDQVVTNLVANAIKYGRGGPIQISISGDEGRVRLTIEDAGIGIEATDLPRLFNRFERAVSERNYGGFGLGLWIVRQIVEALAGTVTVESTPGVGSTFSVDLPRTPALSRPR